MSAAPIIGIIGGSGLYDIDGLANIRWERVESPFGQASDEFLFGQLDGQQFVFCRVMVVAIKFLPLN